MGHYVGDGHGDQDAEVKRSDAIAGVPGAGKGKRSTSNVFKNPQESKLIESMAQDIAVHDAELEYVYEEVDYLHSLELLHNYILVTNTVADGAANTNINSGAWRTRILNTITHDSEGIAKLSSNQITLPSGNYMVTAWAMFVANVNGGFHQIRLRNITAGSTLSYGVLNRTAQGVWSGGLAHLTGEFVLGKTSVLELQHQAAVSGVDGIAASGFVGPENNVRASIGFIKIA